MTVYIDKIPLIFEDNCATSKGEMQDRFLEDIKDRTDIRELVARYTELKKSGKSWRGKSPFRSERTPSFFVDAEKGVWYDFGASEGGDAIAFLEKIENFSFREAVEHLAQLHNLEVPAKFGAQSGPDRSAKMSLYELHKKAAEFFANELQNNPKHKKYLTDRGLTDATIVAWQLGYGGDAADGLTKHLLAAGIDREVIGQSGVAFERSFGDQKMMDRFAERIMIPIREPKEGQIIAFSGRDVTGKSKAKYKNSPENPVYHKSSVLFGLDRARHAIREQDKVVLVEGNFDVIMAHQAGLDMTVATCGTSLTEEHLRIIRRLTKQVILAFDNDIAGKKATLRSVELCLQMGLAPFVMEIAHGKDLDDMLRHDPDLVRQAVANAPSALDFFLEKFSVKFANQGTEGRKKFLDSFFYFLRLVERPIEVDDYLEKIANKLQKPKNIIEQEFHQFGRQKVRYQKAKFVEEKAVSYSREELCVGFLGLFWEQIEDKSIQEVLEALPATEARNLAEKKLRGDLTNEEQVQMSAWELFHSKNYEQDISEEAIERERLDFLKLFRSSQDKESKKKAALAAFYAQAGQN